jgi:hypothetical protein
MAVQSTKGGTGASAAVQIAKIDKKLAMTHQDFPII